MKLFSWQITGFNSRRCERHSEARLALILQHGAKSQIQWSVLILWMTTSHRVRKESAAACLTQTQPCNILCMENEMCSCRLSLPADLSSTGSATLLLPLHSYISLRAVRLLLNINGKFGRCRRGCHHFCFCEALVKLDFHSKYFCRHSAGLFLFFFSPESRDFLVSFLVYIE